LLESFLRNPSRKFDLIDVYQNVTILFADIAGFTKFSGSVPASTVVSMLRQMFTDFDKLALSNSVFKLYTIGDCYVVLGMVDANDRDPITEARNVVMMAFEMIKTIRKVRRDINFPGLDMRIGIHTV
jgi:class 3 adenylate cyclase